MTSQQTTISVVVLSYNRPEELAESLESIIAQEFRELEIIVVDNHSANSEKVAEVVGRFPGTRFFPQSKNLGFAAGMNVGLAVATGDFIHITEDDIILDKNFYDELLPHAVRRAPHAYRQESCTREILVGSLEQHLTSVGGISKKR